MSRELSDEQLLVRYQQADPEAFKEFFKRYRTILYNYLRVLLKNQQDVDDVIQEVFIKIHRSIHQYDVSKKAAYWVFTIARNAAIDALRRRRSRAEVPLTEELTYLGADESAAIEAREGLVTLLKDFSEDDRALILVHFLDNLQTDLHAATLGIKPATLRKRLSRIVAKLKTKPSS